MSSLEYAEIEFMFPDRLGDGAWQVYLDVNFVGQTSQLLDYGQSSKALIYNLPFVVNGGYGDIKSFELGQHTTTTEYPGVLRGQPLLRYTHGYLMLQMQTRPTLFLSLLGILIFTAPHFLFRMGLSM